VAYRDALSCISFVTVKENATLFTPNVYLRSTLATIRAWSLDVYSFAVREHISV
jgi:hypothetical protein